MDASDYIAAGSGVLALAAVVVAVIVAWRQNRIARQDQLFPFVVEVLNRFSSGEYRTAIKSVRALPRQTAAPFESLDSASYEELRPFMNYCNEIGLLVARNAIHVNLVAATMGNSVGEAWQILGPYIYARRIERDNDPNYYAFFEHVAAEMIHLGPQRLEKKLKLKKLPPA